MKINLSGCNINEGHFYIPRKSSLIPSDAWGGSNQSKSATPVNWEFVGTGEKVMTDIASNKRIPRNARGQCKRFFARHSLKAGDQIEVVAISERTFQVRPFSEISEGEANLIPQDVGNLIPNRSEVVIQRIVRDSAVTAKVKRLYNYKCQVCGISISLNNGPYAEGAHIRPLGSPHNGPDVIGNVLCLCPNHHVMFDGGSLKINDDLTFVDAEGCLKVHPEHKIDVSHLIYQRNNV
jgi:CDGSH-type Zn-finger protein